MFGFVNAGNGLRLVVLWQVGKQTNIEWWALVDWMPQHCIWILGAWNLGKLCPHICVHFPSLLLALLLLFLPSKYNLKPNLSFFRSVSSLILARISEQRSSSIDLSGQSSAMQNASTARQCLGSKWRADSATHCYTCDQGPGTAQGTKGMNHN